MKANEAGKKRLFVILGLVAAIILLLFLGYKLIHFWNPATCTEAETCRLCGKTRGEPLGHDWGEPVYEWGEDNGTVTATRVCARDENHVETETVNTTSEVTTEPACEVEGTTTYTAAFANEGFTEQMQALDNLDPIGHSWGEPEYAWAEDNTSVTASRVCENDETHVESETAETESEVAVPATCETVGSTTYTAAFANEAFETQVRTVEDIEPIGHAWGEPSYEWSDDHSTVTATRVCANDPSHIESETVSTAGEIAAEPAVGVMGSTVYTAAFENEAFAAQTMTVEDIEALSAAEVPEETGETESADVSSQTEAAGEADQTEDTGTEGQGDGAEAEGREEDLLVRGETEEAEAADAAWGEPSYAWSEDYSTVTVTRTSQNDASLVETETASVTSEVSVEPTCETAGSTTYSVTFVGEAFEPQTVTREDIEPLGHAWGEPVYAWSEDYSTVTATRVCTRDESHVETETVNTTSEVSIEPTCEAMGSTTYTAEFVSEAFETQTATLENIEALGHAWGEPAYVWSEDYSTVTATRICANDETHVENETVETVSEVLEEPACLTEGRMLYTASFDSEAFAEQTAVGPIPATGHNWSEIEFVWNEDNSALTGTRVCMNDESHVETETAASSVAVTTEPSGEDGGEITYTVSFENADFPVQEITVTAYSLDLDANRDGIEEEDLADWATVDVTLDGELAAEGVNEFNEVLPAGTEYEIGNIAEEDGYLYEGVLQGELAGILNANTQIVLKLESFEAMLQRAQEYGRHRTVAAGYCFAVGLKPDGTCVSSGLYDPGTLFWTDIVSLAAAQDAVVGLKSDGTVVTNEWSVDLSDWTDVIQIDYNGEVWTEDRHLLGLRSDGTVLAAGSNLFGECGVEDWEDIVDVSAGASHTVGLRSDGTVVAVGNNKRGQCDVDDWDHIIDVAAGRFSTYGLTMDGRILVAGDYTNAWGDYVPDVPEWEDVIAIAAGSDSSRAQDFVVGLRSDGTIVSNRMGYLPEGATDVFEDVASVAFSSWGYFICNDENGVARDIGWDAEGTRLASLWPMLRSK